MRLLIIILIISFITIPLYSQTDSVVVIPKQIATKVLMDIKKVELQNKYILIQDSTIQALRNDLLTQALLVLSYKSLENTLNQKIVKKNIVIQNLELIKKDYEVLLKEERKKRKLHKYISYIGIGFIGYSIIK